MKWMKKLLLRPFRGKNAGTTLAELMIASGLLVVVATAATAFLTKIQQSNYSARAQSMAMSELDSWVGQIKRDLDWRKIKDDGSGERTAQGDANISRNIWLSPMAPNVSTRKPQEYLLWYYSYCQGVPGKAKAFFSSKFGNDFNFSAQYINDHYKKFNLKCMPAADCPDGTYPQIVRTRENRPDLDVRHYPNDVLGGDGSWRGVIPVFPDGVVATDHLAAVASCIVSDGGPNDRVVIEAAMVTPEGKMTFERRELLAPRKNIANIQALSN